MGIQQIIKRLTGNDAVDRVQDDLIAFSESVIEGRVLDNVIVENVSLGTTTTTISHNLGRRPTGWIVIKKNADTNVWEPEASPRSESLIKLKASTNVTVTLLFF